jgi:hypothetical protein
VVLFFFFLLNFSFVTHVHGDLFVISILNLGNPKDFSAVVGINLGIIDSSTTIGIIDSFENPYSNDHKTALFTCCITYSQVGIFLIINSFSST